MRMTVWGKSAFTQAISRLKTKLQKYKRQIILIDTADFDDWDNRLGNIPQFQEQERDTGRYLDVADLLFDAIGTAEPGIDDILEWTGRYLFDAIVVLWGVCWMFYSPDMQSEHGANPDSEAANGQQEFWSNWGSDLIQNGFGNNWTVQQHIEDFNHDSQQSYRQTESHWLCPWTENQLMIRDTLVDVPSTDAGFEEIPDSFLTFQTSEVLQQYNYHVEANDESHEFNRQQLLLEATAWENLPVDAERDIVASATSPASSGCTNLHDKQQKAVVSNGNSNPSKPPISITETNVDCMTSDRNAPTSGNNKAQQCEKHKSNGRQFLCDVEGCDLAFTRAYELDRHKGGVHGEGQRFPCPKASCRFSILGAKGPFGRKDKLRDHINNVHPDIDLRSIPELRQVPRPMTQPTTGNKRIEDKPDPRGSMSRQSYKRRRISSAKSDSLEVQESPDIELKRLRGMLEELREENRQREERHKRELEDLKDQNRSLRKEIEDVLKKTGE